VDTSIKNIVKTTEITPEEMAEMDALLAKRMRAEKKAKNEA
jgi:hypothetical protein